MTTNTHSSSADSAAVRSPRQTPRHTPEPIPDRALRRMRILAWRAAASRRRLFRSERGDVPAWVLITIMSAGSDIALWALALPLLSQVFEDAVRGVKGP